MPVTKEEAVRLRGGHEMKKIFTIIPYVKGAGQKRPHTVQTLDSIKYGSSGVITKHNVYTCEKYKARDRAVLMQRSTGYPVCVPDLSKGATDETVKRRTVHKNMLEMDKEAFRKKFYPECTSDWFNQKHLSRNYLNTMHPYTDLEDRGRKYTESRLKIKERDLAAMPTADFIQPQDPVRPRSTGYSPGHTRSLLGLDSFGPRMAERQRLAREVGELPDSPNVDREKALIKPVRSTSPDLDSRASSPGNSTVSTVPGSADSRNGRRPKTMSQLDDADMYLPPMMTRANNYRTNNQETGSPDFDSFVDVNEMGVSKNQENGFVPVGGDGFDLPTLTPPAMVLEYGGPIVNPKVQRASTADSKGRVTIDERLDFDDNMSKGSKARSRTSSRGGSKPTPAPPNPHTQTGTLGYHGQAIGKYELLMKDSIGRGVEWYQRYADGKKKKMERQRARTTHQKKRADMQKDITGAIKDLKDFEVALEFRRTAKPGDLPENNTKRAKTAGQTKR